MSTHDCVRSVCVLAVVLLCSGAATALNMNHICLLMENDKLIASGDSCTSYYHCLNGIAVAQNCSSGSYFDKNAQICIGQRPSYCIAPNTDPCDGLATGTYVPVPGSCSGFYYCSAKGAQLSNCPNNLVFNPTTVTCDYRTSSNCQDPTEPVSGSADSAAINICSYVPDDVYFGNSFNCADWDKCHGNVHSTGSCNDGLLFDTTSAICNYPADVSCTQVTNDPDLEVSSASNGGTCTQDGAIKKGIPCNQYYVCNNGNWELQVCSGSLYFDTESQSCVNRLDAHNNCDRCLGTTDEFVNESGTNCTGYLSCANETEIGGGACGNGLFFNEVLGGCIDENPEFAVCKSSSTTTVPPATTEDTTEASTVKPATEATTVKSATEATTVKSAAEATTVKPAAEETTVKPAAEATTVKPAA